MKIRGSCQAPREEFFNTPRMWFLQQVACVGCEHLQGFYSMSTGNTRRRNVAGSAVLNATQKRRLGTSEEPTKQLLNTEKKYHGSPMTSQLWHWPSRSVHTPLPAFNSPRSHQKAVHLTPKVSSCHFQEQRSLLIAGHKLLSVGKRERAAFKKKKKTNEREATWGLEAESEMRLL